MLKILFKAASQNNLDLFFPISSALSVRVVERPGLWMTQEDLADLSGQLSEVAARTLDGKTLNYGIFGSDPKSFENAIITMVVHRDSNVPIAFNALSLIRIDLGHRWENVLHLGLVLVDPSAQQKGLSWVLYGLTCLLMFVRNGLRPIWVSNVTQVPAVVGLVARGLSSTFPAPHKQAAGQRSLLQLLLARRIMSQHRSVFGVGPDAQFNEDTFVISNAYTGGSDHLKKTFDATAKHREDVFNQYCSETLDYDRGDDVLQLGRLDMSSALGFVTKDIPASSSVHVFLAIIAMVLQRMIVPFTQWLNPSRDFGILQSRSGSA